MPDQTLAERLPAVFPSYDDSTDFSAWLEAHQDEVDTLQADLDAVQESFQVAHATGEELDLIGADFGLLGKRRGRSDDAYRQYLMSLIQAYSGRGTPPGLKTAIASGVLATADDVGLIEDFTANRYEVELYDWEAHKTGTVHTLANVADPSVIQRRDPLHYITGSADITVSTDSTIAKGIHNLVPGASVAVTPSPTDTSSIAHVLANVAAVVAGSPATNQTVKVGLSGHQLGNGNQLGDGL